MVTEEKTAPTLTGFEANLHQQFEDRAPSTDEAVQVAQKKFPTMDVAIALALAGLAIAGWQTWRMEQLAKREGGGGKGGGGGDSPQVTGGGNRPQCQICKPPMDAERTLENGLYECAKGHRW